LKHIGVGKDADARAVAGQARACARAGGARAHMGSRMWAWLGAFPGAGFWTMLHLAITIRR